MTINERFFELLKEKNYTQKQFSIKTGIPEQTISAWKKRKSDPPANLLYTIADFLNVSLDFLITGTENENKTLFKNNEENLSAEERFLINTYREVSDEGKYLIQESIRDIWADHRIKKSSKKSDPKHKDVAI